MEFNFKVDKDVILSLFNRPPTTNLEFAYRCPHPSGLKSYFTSLLDCLNQTQPTPNDETHTDQIQKNEVPKDEVPKDEVPKDEVPKDEVLKDEVPKDDVLKDEIQEKQREEIFDRILKPLGVELDDDLKEMLKELEKGSIGEVLTDVTESVESIYKVPIHAKEMANGLSDCLRGFEKYADSDQKENLSLFQQSLDHFRDCRTVADLIKLFTKLQSGKATSK